MPINRDPAGKGGQTVGRNRQWRVAVSERRMDSVHLKRRACRRQGPRYCHGAEDGTVWFGTNKGISCFNGTKWTTYNMKTGMSWNDTKALAYDSRKTTIGWRQWVTRT